MIMWSNGKFVKANQVSTLNWVMHYSGSAWEGIRSYEVANNGTVHPFALTDHVSRLFDSAKILRLQIPYTQDQIRQAIRDLQIKIGPVELYFRPIVYPMKDAEGKADDERVGVDIYAFELPNGFPKKGIKVQTSFKSRAYPHFEMQCKSSNNYGALEQLRRGAKNAKVHDFLLTDGHGNYTEATTANLFVVRRNKIWTPPNDGSILPGLTRAFTIEQTGAQEKKVTRPELITASEVFITGTYAEITPVVEIDGYKIGDGKPGPTTNKCREAYFHAVRNRLWLGTFGQSYYL